MNINRFLTYLIEGTRQLFKTIVCFIFLFALFSFQGKKEISEPTIKALFLYNFTKYVEWTTEKNSAHFIIGFYGTSNITDELKLICTNKKVKNRDIEIRQVTELSEIEKCDIIFISKSQSDYLKNINELVQAKEILIVTEEKGMALQGAAINIIAKDDKIRFELNESAIKKAGLKVSNQLLSLGIIINNEKQ